MSNYGILKNGLPAERQRGLIFCEKFESEAEVIRNGGVVNGNPTFNQGMTQNSNLDYLAYPSLNLGSVHTLILDVTVLSDPTAGGQCYISSSTPGYFLFITKASLIYNCDGNAVVSGTHGIQAGDRVRVAVVRGESNITFYLNGNSIKVSSYPYSADLDFGLLGRYFTAGSLYNSDAVYHSVRLFNKALTPEEILDYYNESVFDYEREAVLNLPMGLAQHDVDNNRSLDVSGNNNNVEFGDGATAGTFPDKIVNKHGYSFDGSDDYMHSENPVVLEECTFASLVKFDANSLNAIMCHGETGDLFNLGVGVQSGIGTDNQINFSMFSTSWKVADSGITPQLGKVYSVVGTFDGTTLSIYVDGELRGTNTAVSDSRSLSVQIGKRFDASNPNNFDGDIYSAFVLDKALTPMQVQDLHNRMMKGINRK
jgi:hypothetical protein